MVSPRRLSTPPLERGEDQQLDRDADHEDQHDRGDDQRHLGQLAADVEQLAEALAQARRVGDQLGGHERAPGERPALPQTAEVAGQRGRAAARTGSGRAPTGPSTRPTRSNSGGTCFDAAEQAVGDRRHGAQQDDGVDGGVRQLEPDDRRRHPGDRRQALQPADDRPDARPAASGSTTWPARAGVPITSDIAKPTAPRLQAGPDRLERACRPARSPRTSPRRRPATAARRAA